MRQTRLLRQKPAEKRSNMWTRDCRNIDIRKCRLANLISLMTRPRAMDGILESRGGQFISIFISSLEKSKDHRLLDPRTYNRTRKSSRNQALGYSHDYLPMKIQRACICSRYSKSIIWALRTMKLRKYLSWEDLSSTMPLAFEIAAIYDLMQTSPPIFSNMASSIWNTNFLAPEKIIPLWLFLSKERNSGPGIPDKWLPTHTLWKTSIGSKSQFSFPLEGRTYLQI